MEKYCKAHDIKLTKPKQLLQNDIPEAMTKHYWNIYQKNVMINMVHIPKLNLNWCLVPKVASTSISSAILPYLNKLKKHKQFSHLQGEVWSRAGHMTYKEYHKHANTTPAFLITRHPFARVASAFRNKLEDRTRSHDGEYFYNTHSRHIIK